MVVPAQQNGCAHAQLWVLGEANSERAVILDWLVGHGQEKVAARAECRLGLPPHHVARLGHRHCVGISRGTVLCTVGRQQAGEHGGALADSDAVESWQRG